MKPSEHLNVIDRFLINYFSGEATNEEESFVQRWKSETPENSIYFKNLKKLWIQRVVL